MILQSEWLSVLKAAALFIVGFIVIVKLSRYLQTQLATILGKHISLLIRHTVFYGGAIVLILMALSQLGFNVSALLGAAGIVGVTIGFASQTTVSNIISGIFLLLERSFKIGDQIECQQASGKIESIDLLSVQLKTKDGQLIRLPNEMLLKNVVKNRTFYHYRRLTFYATLRHDASAREVIETINSILKSNSLISSCPDPSITFNRIYFWGTKISIQFLTKTDTTTQAASSFVQLCSEHDKTKNLTLYQSE